MRIALYSLTSIAFLTGSVVAQAPARQAGKPLTLRELGDRLEFMGYNPTPFKDKQGAIAGYDLEFKSGDWMIRFSVGLSKDKSQIWFDGGVASFLGTSPPTAEALLEILAENNALWPASVSYSKPSKKLVLSQAVPNKEMTAAELRTQLEGFSESIKTVITKFNQAMEAAGADTSAVARRKIE